MAVTLGKIKNNAKTTKKQNQTRKGYGYSNTFWSNQKTALKVFVLLTFFTKVINRENTIFI